MTEEWRDVPGYEGCYQINSSGVVKSLDRRCVSTKGWVQHTIGRVLKPQRCTNGYMFYPLCKDGVVKQHLIHRLVLSAFVGKSELEVNHKDGNRENNNLDNLEYVTRHENQIHAFRVLKRPPVRSWLGKSGFEHNKSFGVRVINVITGTIKEFGSYRIADKKGFRRSTIRKYIDTGKILHHRYKFERI